MLIPGICSITLKSLSPEELIDFGVTNRLSAIEWWADGHVLPGEEKHAAKVGHMTREAGLRVSSYGSYYRVGVSEAEEMPFEDVLESAVALGAPTIRVWAGNKNREEADPSTVAGVISDTCRIADLAARHGISVTFEFHGGTLTNSNANALRFAEEVPHPNVFFSWQPPNGFTQEHSVQGLNAMLSRLMTLHCFHWTIGSYEKNLVDETHRELIWPTDYYRHPLAEGRERWQAYLQSVRTSGRDHCVLLEFVANDSLHQAREDAAVLVDLCTARS